MNEIEKPDVIGAHRRAESIRQGLRGFIETRALIQEAFDNNDWITLGYTSWEAYCDKEFSVKQLRLTREERTEAALAFRDAGMTLREIGAALGTSPATAMRDLGGLVSSETKEPQVNDQASGPAATSPADGSGTDRPTTAASGEAEDRVSSAADAEASANQTGSEAPPASDPVDEPEQPAAGVSPAAPDSGKTFDEVLDEHSPDPDPHRRWRAAFLKGVRQSYVLSEFADEDIVANGNDLCFEELINLRDFFDEKLRRVQELRLQNLPDNVREFRRPA